MASRRNTGRNGGNGRGNSSGSNTVNGRGSCIGRGTTGGRGNSTTNTDGTPASSNGSSTSSSSTSRTNHREEDGSNQRRRTLLTPLDDSLVLSRMNSRMKEVSINRLTTDDAFNMNLNRNCLTAQLLRCITPSANQRANIYSSRRRNAANNQEVTFKRLFLCRIHPESSTDHDNARLIYLMEARNSNNNLFDQNMELRDNGTFSIGTFFRILAPLPIENTMNGDIPLVRTQNPLLILHSPKKIPTVPVNNSIQGMNAMAFVYNAVSLTVNRTTPIQTTCGGFMCDRQRIQDWNGNRGCGCYEMTDYVSNLAFEHSIFFETPNGKISHTNFSSTKFSLLYLSTFLPGSVRVSALRMSSTSGVFWDIEDAIENITSYVNDNGGWTAVGWYKRGVITDKSLLVSGVTTNVNNEESDQIDSGHINYHVVQLLPTNKSILRTTSTLGSFYETMKYDVSNLPQA